MLYFHTKTKRKPMDLLLESKFMFRYIKDNQLFISDSESVRFYLATLGFEEERLGFHESSNYVDLTGLGKTCTYILRPDEACCDKIVISLMQTNAAERLSELLHNAPEDYADVFTGKQLAKFLLFGKHCYDLGRQDATSFC